MSCSRAARRRPAGAGRSPDTALEPGCAGGVELGALAAVFHVDLIHILHQLQRLLFADVLVEGAAELIGDVILSVGKGTGAAEAVHNGAGGASERSF